MKLHYSQTISFANIINGVFQYLMKLHYSQTLTVRKQQTLQFQYLMKLHYSQTISGNHVEYYKFQYLMKLHYSQTVPCYQRWTMSFSTLWNYTTLKLFPCLAQLNIVSVPYEITLLSNMKLLFFELLMVSVPYEITLLSNFCRNGLCPCFSFSTLWNYTTLKL